MLHPPRSLPATLFIIARTRPSELKLRRDRLVACRVQDLGFIRASSLFRPRDGILPQKFSPPRHRYDGEGVAKSINYLSVVQGKDVRSQVKGNGGGADENGCRQPSGVSSFYFIPIASSSCFTIIYLRKPDKSSEETHSNCNQDITHRSP